MMPKFAAQDANKILYRLDRISHTIQAQYKTWGMPLDEAKQIVAALDTTADEIEVAAFGAESLQARQANIVQKIAEAKTAAAQPRTAEVIKKETDEPYMNAFANPMAPIQVEADEPYMKAYGPPDQSSAVIHGTSTTGRPLTSH